VADFVRRNGNDYYEVLQVSPNASQEVIQAAYRVLVRNCHPDWHADAEATSRAVELNAAYAILSSSDRRAEYDLQRSLVKRSERAPMAALEPRPAVRGGHALIIVALVAAVAVVLVVMLWLAVDGATEDVPLAVHPSQPVGATRIQSTAPQLPMNGGAGS
jgi:preprotein translocase subunit Sec63